MIRPAAVLWVLALSGTALAAAAPDPVRSLAGRYTAHFQNGTIDGQRYASDDVLEIAPVGPRHAYVRLALHFFNGHSCGLHGVAAAEGNTLVFRDQPSFEANRAQCVLRIQRKGDKLVWSDADGSCRNYCGTRGGFANGSLAWSSKRPIRYMARLKASSPYRQALAAWKKEQ